MSSIVRNGSSNPPGSGYHLVGAGGIGMSALAKALVAQGFRVYGSDRSFSVENPTKMQEDLAAHGVHICPGHDARYVLEGAQGVIYSSAVAKDHPELLEAHKKGIPVLHRSEALRELLSQYRPWAVTGTHGKTSITAWLGHALERGGYDPLVLAGGVVPQWQSNARPGQGPLAVVEADESDGSFLNFSGLAGGIISNVEPDHLENYSQDMAVLERAFTQFLNLSPKSPYYLCSDDPGLRALLTEAKPGDWHLYGAQPVREKALQGLPGIQLLDFKLFSWGSRFDLEVAGVRWPSVEIQSLGYHSILNSLPVIGAASHAGMDEPSIRQALVTFKGVDRRLTHVGSAQGATFMDDYAHHPTAIRAVLDTLKECYPGKITVIFEPHRYSRLNHLWAEFLESLEKADCVYTLPVYSAGENSEQRKTSQDFVKSLADSGKNSYLAVGQTPGEIAHFLGNCLKSELEPGDLVVALGAGSSTQVIRELVDLCQGPFLEQEPAMAWREKVVGRAIPSTQVL